MSDTRLKLIVTIFHITLGVAVFIESVLAVHHAMFPSGGEPSNMKLGLFAGVEAVAAILFIVRRTVMIGGVALLLIFGAAVVIHGFLHGLPLIVYAAGVMLMMAWHRS